MRDLAPTKFSHSEEWQQVLYGLRFEIENSMLSNRISHDQDKKLVSGISEGEFSFYTRIFYEVFIQDIPEKYLSRVSELGHRILFIVGGADPIVKTKSLLDASPKGGINMIEIANLGHFLTHEAKDREGQWTNFWFPTVMNLIVEFSKSAGEVYLQSLIKDWAFIQNRNSNVHNEGSNDEEKVVIKNDILESEDFGKALTKMVKEFEKEDSSWLFIARNKPPNGAFW